MPGNVQVATTESLDAKELLSVLFAVKKGDFSVRMAPDRGRLPEK